MQIILLAFAIERVGIFFDAYLVGYHILFLLILNVFRYRLFVPTYRIHIEPPTPEVSLSVLIGLLIWCRNHLYLPKEGFFVTWCYKLYSTVRIHHPTRNKFDYAYSVFSRQFYFYIDSLPVIIQFSENKNILFRISLLLASQILVATMSNLFYHIPNLQTTPFYLYFYSHQIYNP